MNRVVYNNITTRPFLKVSNVNTNLASEQNDKPVSSLNKEIEVLERQLKDLEIKHAQELKEGMYLFNA